MPDDGTASRGGLDRIFAVLDVVAALERGEAACYGEIAAAAGTTARFVGHVLARHGDEVPWYRVVRSDGTPAPQIADRQLARLALEGVPFRRDGRRVDLPTVRRAFADSPLRRSIAPQPTAAAPSRTRPRRGSGRVDPGNGPLAE